MIVYTAHFARLARSKFLTWILAFAVYARLIVRTFGIAATAEDCAGDIWIASVSRRTFAHGVVVYAKALGVLTTRSAIGSACGHTLTIDA